MNDAKKFLLKNKQHDIVLNAEKYPENTYENSLKWIYLSDILLSFAKCEKQKLYFW